MSERAARAYTLDELEKLREIARDQFVSEGVIYGGFGCGSREMLIQYHATITPMIEERVRTMLVAGVEP